MRSKINQYATAIIQSGLQSRCPPPTPDPKTYLWRVGFRH